MEKEKIKKIKQRQLWLKNNPYYYENYRVVNKEKLKKYNKDYRIKNPQKYCEYNKSYYEKQKNKSNLERLLFNKLEEQEKYNAMLLEIESVKENLKLIYDTKTNKFNIPTVKI
jgi:hypothetical protein